MGFWSDVGGGLKSIGKSLPVVGPIISSIDDKVPSTQAADDAAKRAQGVADESKKYLDEARGRETNPGTIVASTVEPTTVGPAPIRSGETVTKAGTTHAPGEVVIDPAMAAQIYTPESVKGIGGRIAGKGVDDTVDAGIQNWQVNRTGAGYQNDAAAAFGSLLSGNSLADKQLAADRDRAAAEQLSQAAGARGANVASARRNAAINTGLQDVEYGGKAAELRAQEIAQAAQGLAGVGGTMQGQSLQETTSKTGFNQQVELANVQAKDTAIQASRERFARGEISQAQLDADISKANAQLQQQTNELNTKTQTETKLDHAHQQLQADLASDDRLQASFNLEAQLKDKAAAGNQQAILDLQKLQSTIDQQMKEFNATQIQTATGQNIQNRLTALKLDDAFVESMTQAWQNAESTSNTAALDAIKIKIQAKMDQAAQDKGWHDAFKADAQDAFKALATKGIGSDVRVKEDIQKISPEDMDAFLLSVGTPATWKYKDPQEHGEGTFFGQMAQDIGSSKLGKHAVKPDDKGVLRLDMQRLAALALAGVGRLHQRVEKIEGKKPSAGPDVAGFLRARGKI